MSSLTDIYNDISSHDVAYLEKQAAQLQKTADLEKQAEEEDAAGRITARGFADELNKLASAGLVGRGLAWGGAIGAGDHVVSKINAKRTGRYWEAPQRGLLQSILRGAAIGAAGGAAIKGVGKLSKK